MPYQKVKSILLERTERHRLGLKTRTLVAIHLDYQQRANDLKCVTLGNFLGTGVVSFGQVKGELLKLLKDASTSIHITFYSYEDLIVRQAH